MTIACADCGCLVDRGIRVESCPDSDCCCRHLPVATADDEAAQRPTWTTAREALAVVFDRRHLVASTRIAAVVGTVLFAINQLDVRDPGTGDTRDMGEGCLTYLVPFTVANLGILTATRRPKL